jgi:hypothetical protein
MIAAKALAAEIEKKLLSALEKKSHAKTQRRKGKT